MAMSLTLAELSGHLKLGLWSSNHDHNDAFDPHHRFYSPVKTREIGRDVMRDELREKGYLPANYPTTNPETILAYLRNHGFSGKKVTNLRVRYRRHELI
jgi:hypothetical protein